MAADATFWFDTNIDDVAAHIEAGLQRVNRASKIPTNNPLAAGINEQYPAQLRQIVERSMQEIGRYQAALHKLGSPPPGAGNYTDFFRQQLTSLRRANAELGAQFAVPLRTVHAQDTALRTGFGKVGQQQYTNFRDTQHLTPAALGTGDLRARPLDIAAVYQNHAAQIAPTLTATERWLREQLADDTATASTKKRTSRAAQEIATSTEQVAAEQKRPRTPAQGGSASGGGGRRPPTPPAAPPPDEEPPRKRSLAELEAGGRTPSAQFAQKVQQLQSQMVQVLTETGEQEVEGIRRLKGDLFEHQASGQKLRYLHDPGPLSEGEEQTPEHAAYRPGHALPIEPKQDLGYFGDSETQRLKREASQFHPASLQESLDAFDDLLRREGDDVRRLKPNLFLDMASGVAQYAEATSQGAKVIKEATPKFIAAQEVHRKADREASGKANLQGLYTERPGELKATVSDLGGGYYAQAEQGVKTFWKRFGDELHDITNENVYAAEAARREAKAIPAAGRSVPQGFFHGLLSGGFGGGGAGDGLAGLAQAAGQTLKYNTLYHALSLVQQGLAQAAAEMVNFADSSTNLQIAMDSATQSISHTNVVSQDLINSLSEISIQAGSNVGDVMDIAAQGVRSLGTNTKFTKDQVKEFGTEYATQAQRLAVLTSTDVKDAAGNIRAIAEAFNIPLNQTSRINDAIVAARNQGGDPTQGSQALASFAEGAQAGGFTPELAAALAFQVQAATDTGGEAVGQQLSRIISNASGNSAQSLLAQINATQGPQDQINLAAKPQDQLIQLSKLATPNADGVTKLSEAQRKLVISTFAGSTATRQFNVVLRELASLNDQTTKSTGNAGLAAKDYQRRMHDLSETVRTFRGALSQIIINLGNSGLLDPLIAGFVALTNVLRVIAFTGGAVDSVVQKLNKTLRSTTAIVLGLVAAMALVGKINQTGGVGQFLGGVEGKLAPGRSLSRELLAERAAKDAAESAAVSGAEKAAKRGIITSTVEGVGGLVSNPFVVLTAAVLGGAYVIGQVKDHATQLSDAMDAAQAAINASADAYQQSDLATRLNDLKNAASAAATAKNAIDQAGHGVFGHIVVGPEQRVESRRLGFQARYDNAQASKLVQQQQALDANAASVSVFGDAAARTTDGVANALQRLSDQGYSATERLKLLTELLAVAATSKGVKTVTDPNKINRLTLAQDAAKGLLGAERIDPLFNVGATRTGDLGDPNNKRTIGPSPFATLLSKNAKGIEQLIEDNLPADTQAGGVLTTQQLDTLKAAVAGKLLPQYQKIYDTLNPDQKNLYLKPDKFVQYIKDKVAAQLGGRDLRTAIAPPPKLSSADLLADLTKNIVPTAQAALQELTPGDNAGKLKIEQNELASLNGDLANLKPGTDAADLGAALAVKRQLLAQIATDEVADDEKMRQALQARAGSATAIQQIGQQFYAKEAFQTLAGGDRDALVQLINSGSQQDADIVTKELQHRVDVATAQAKAADQAARTAPLVSTDPRTGGDALVPGRHAPPGTPTASQKQANAALKSAQEQQAAFAAALKAAIPTGTNFDKGTDAAGQAEQYRLSLAENLISTRNAAYLGGSALADATHTLADEQLRLKAYTLKDKGWYDQLGKVNAAKLALANAQNDAAYLTAQLAGDLTNPVQAALAAYNDAKARTQTTIARVKQDKTLTPAQRQQEVGEAKLNQEQKQASYEASVQSQYLSSLQTAEQLGRITHSQYISLLRGRADQLTAELATMKTTDPLFFQIGQERDQFLAAAKAAADQMDSQFNLGDIKIPTPYQVRRSIQEKLGGVSSILGNNNPFSTGGGVTYHNPTSNVVLNGVPVEQIITLLSDLFGIKVQSSAGRRY